MRHTVHARAPREMAGLGGWSSGDRAGGSVTMLSGIVLFAWTATHGRGAAASRELCEGCFTWVWASTDGKGVGRDLRFD